MSAKKSTRDCGFMLVQGAALAELRRAAASLKAAQVLRNPVVGRSRERFYRLDAKTFRTLTSFAS